VSDAPGRPSSVNLVIEEAKRRLDSGSAPKLLKAFGRDLSKWLSETHPNSPQMQPEVVENNIRHHLRAEWKRSKNN
jgi:hypothetical protein